jgi:hypothetical protein
MKILLLLFRFEAVIFSFGIATFAWSCPSLLRYAKTEYVKKSTSVEERGYLAS